MQIEIPSDVVKTTIVQKLQTLELKSKKDFAKMYSTIIGCFLELSPASIAILEYYTENYHFSCNVIAFVPKVLEKISFNHNLTEKDLKKGLVQLTKKKVLLRRGSIFYEIQKEYCWVGPDKVINVQYVLDISFKE